MPKTASIITVAKQGEGYRVDARGAFGGGWQRHVKANELSSAITIAWQQYGSNPLGCEIIGDMPDPVRVLADKLQASGEGKAVLTIRVSEGEADLIRAAAEGEGKSLNQWAREKLIAAL